MVGRGYPELHREEGSSPGGDGAGRVDGKRLPRLCGLRWWRKSDPLLGEHGGGVRGAANSAPVLLPERGTPPSAPAPIAVQGRREPHAPSPGAASLGETAAPLAPPRPIRSDTNTWGHARFRRPPNPGGHKQRARPGPRAAAPQCEASGRDGRAALREPLANRAGRGLDRDERSLEALSLAAGGGGAAAGRQLPEGRRATLASALELEGTVLREGRLTQFVANNLERRIRLSGAPRSEPPAAAAGGGGSIPAIDPGALQDVVALAGQVAAQVDELLRNVHCGLQALTALSVGCIQTYRDGVESLGEAADLSIRAMYALVARCEELDRAMQPVPALAKRIRDMKGTLERLEGLCK
uniref:BLOC-1 related complex subunit 6 n=1 Tax=Falco tinnunculus TaxID=100819 RepID=A0A8C4UKQ4_FALTI